MPDVKPFRTCYRCGNDRGIYVIRDHTVCRRCWLMLRRKYAAERQLSLPFMATAMGGGR